MATNSKDSKMIWLNLKIKQSRLFRSKESFLIKKKPSREKLVDSALNLESISSTSLRE